MRNLPSHFASRPFLAGSVFLVSGTFALAQVEQLPASNQSQAQVDQLNRQMGNHEQARGLAQQQQFETNRLQTEMQTAPSPIRPPVIGRMRP
jgi:hypothetical protein